MILLKKKSQCKKFRNEKNSCSSTAPLEYFRMPGVLARNQNILHLLTRDHIKSLLNLIQ